MSTTKRSLALCVTALVLSPVVAFGSAVAHPPQTPFDLDSFSPPIQQGKLEIKLEKVATGLTAPVKAVAAPGLRSTSSSSISPERSGL